MQTSVYPIISTYNVYLVSNAIREVFKWSILQSILWIFLDDLMEYVAKLGKITYNYIILG